MGERLVNKHEALPGKQCVFEYLQQQSFGLLILGNKKTLCFIAI